jgi:hypothetical protein
MRTAAYTVRRTDPTGRTRPETIVLAASVVTGDRLGASGEGDVAVGLVGEGPGVGVVGHVVVGAA